MNTVEAYKRMDGLIPPFLAKHDGVNEYDLRNFVRNYIGSEAVNFLVGWLTVQVGDKNIVRDHRTHRFYLSDQIVKSPYL